MLPGDVIYLKSNDYVPCDCIIIDGECMVNESNLTGKLNVYKKIPLESNNEIFNYKKNRDNILFHGMRIIKVFSKINEEYISAISVNTGPNTYKANLYSNLLYFDEKNKNNSEHNLFRKTIKKILIDVIILLAFSFVMVSFFSYVLKLRLNGINIKDFLYNIIFRIFCKSVMSVYYITNKILTIISLYKLRNKKIICFDNSCIDNSGNINIIFFNKTGLLCKDSFEIYGYHPLQINNIAKGINKLSFSNYLRKQCKEMSINLFKYYKSYFNNKKNNKGYIMNKSNEYISLFIECLLSCNDIEKYNLELFGNEIETGFFYDMNWDIKIYDCKNKEEYLNDNNNSMNSMNSFCNNNKNNNKSRYNNHNYLIENRIIDIYPKNYYKITESLKFDKKIIERRKTLHSLNFNDLNIYDNSSLNIIKMIEQLYNINSYKLRIFKKFIKNGSLNCSAIVYNLLTKELRFMTKGIPEYILKNCNKNSLPDNLEYIISTYRKKGFIIIACATKLININEYEEINEIDYYMNNLTFCGFITLKNSYDGKIINAINQLNEYNCKYIITSGDNEYNCLSAGFNNHIIDNKNVYTFDKDDNHNKIIIRRIYSIKKNDEEKGINGSSDHKYSRRNSNNMSLSNMKSKDNSFNITQCSSQNNNSANKNKNMISKKKQGNGQYYEWKTPEIMIKTGNYEKLANKSKNKDKRKNNGRKIDDDNNISQNSVLDNYSNQKDKSARHMLKTTNRISSIDQKINIDNIDQLQNSKLDNKINIEYNSTKKSNDNIYKSNTITKFEEFYYYPGIFKDFNDLKKNSIYCISSKAFNFLYKNRKYEASKYLLKKIYKRCNIFYNMSSVDKSLVIEFYKKYNKNNYICSIGECHSDMDSILSSNIGISFKNQNNRNMITSHFYSSNHDIFCIKQIIIEGKVFYENDLILKKFSFICTAIIDCYIYCCFISNIDVIEKQLNFLEIEFLFLSVISFTGKAKKHIVFEPLLKNGKLLNIYYMVQQIVSSLMKALSLFLLYLLYQSDTFIVDINDQVFVSYYFVLSIEFIICVIYSFKSISFYTISPFTNILLLFSTLLILLYMIILITLNSSNFKYDFLDMTIFEYSKVLMDSFSDKNRHCLLYACEIDFTFSIILSTIVYYIFDKIAKYKISKNNEKEKEKDIKT